MSSRSNIHNNNQITSLLSLIVHITRKIKRGVDQGGKDGPLVTPMQIQWEFIESKLREMGFTSETVAAAAAAYAEEREAESRSRLNQDLPGDMSVNKSRMGGAGTEVAET